MNTQNTLYDVDGTKLTTGCFAELLDSTEGIIAGPYKYKGPFCGGHIWSIGDQDMLCMSLDRGRFKVLDWKRWRNKEVYFERFRAWQGHSQAESLIELYPICSNNREFATHISSSV